MSLNSDSYIISNKNILVEESTYWYRIWTLPHQGNIIIKLVVLLFHNNRMSHDLALNIKI